MEHQYELHNYQCQKLNTLQNRSSHLRCVCPKSSPILKPPLCTTYIHLKTTIYICMWCIVVVLGYIRTLIFLALRHKQQFSKSMPQRQSCVENRVEGRQHKNHIQDAYSQGYNLQWTTRNLSRKDVDPYNGSTFDVVHIIV